MAQKKTDDPYRKIALLGEGGSSKVWVVEDERRRGSRYALKELVAPDRQDHAILRSEFATLSTLRHPNLIEVYEFGFSPDRAHARFTLEHVDGVNIVEAIRRDPACLFDLTVETLRALAFLHDFGLVHGDVKPENILVREHPRDGARVVLLDFGLSIRYREAGLQRALGGTPAYMAHELFSGSLPSRRSDLYALGAVVHHAIVGRPPALPDGIRIVGQDETEADHRALEAPPGIHEWLDNMLDVVPANRPASAAEALGRMNAACSLTHPLELGVTRQARLQSGEPPGMEAELAELSGLLANDRARVIFLTGESGSGKTRVLRWSVSCSIREGRDVRFLPATGHAGEHGLGFVKSDSVSGTRSPLLVVDDAEDASAAVLRMVEAAAGGSSGSVQVVIACRQADIRSDGLARMVEFAGLTPGLARVNLKPLGREAIAVVCARATGGHPESEHVNWLSNKSEGVAARLEALIVDQSWEHGTRQAGAQLLDRATERRIEALSVDAACLLEAACVLEYCDGDDLVAVGQLSLERIVAAAVEVERSGLVVREGESWKPVSRRIRSHVIGSLDRPRYRTLHRRAAEHLIRVGRLDSPRLARLCLNAGEVERSLEFAIRSANEAARASDHDEAAEWLRFAVLQLCRDDPRRRDWREQQAFQLELAGRFRAASRAWATVARLSVDDAVRTISWSRQARALARSGHPDLAMELAIRSRSLADATDSRSARAHAGYAMGVALFVQGKDDAAVTVLTEAASKCEPRGEIVLRAEILHLCSICLSRLRRLAAARPMAVEALRLAQEQGDARLQANVSIALATLDKREGRLESALRTYDEVRQLIEQHGLKKQRASLVANRVVLLHDLGRYDQCIEQGTEGEALALNVGDPTTFLVCRGTRADALIDVGRPAEAIGVLDAILDQPHSTFERTMLGYIKGTLADAVLQSPRPNLRKASSLIDEVMRVARREPKLRRQILVIELERRLFPECDEGFESAWRAYLDDVANAPAMVHVPTELRARITFARHLLGAGCPAESEEECLAAANQAQQHDLPSYAARALALLVEAREAQADAAGAQQAFEQGNAALEEAADRIHDVDIRRDFLDRPVFRALRKSPALGRSAKEQRLLAVYDMIRELNSEKDPDALLESMLDMALQVVRAERGMILIRDDAATDYEVRLARNLEHETIEDATEFSRGVVARAGAGKPVLAIDTGSDERLRAMKSVSLYGIRSVLCVPLRSRGEIAGAVYLDSRAHGAIFDAEDLQFLEAFADHAALALENARTQRSLERENRRLQVLAESRSRLDDIHGRSRAMQSVYDLILKYAESHLPVLIQGESGTGKELVARAIHANGPRRRREFLSENCAAIPDSLLESELFGHVKGAFTGADRDRQGLFEAASGGTLFLDEVGDMPAAMQARLLRALQEAEVRPVGADRPVSVDVRVLAATNRVLRDEVAAGAFREDLFYRLQVLTVTLPPLRERHGDVPLLVEWFLRRISDERGVRPPTIQVDVVDLFERYAWPGNVRQLENVVQRLALLAGEGPIDLDVLRSDPGLRKTLIDETRSGGAVLSLGRNERDRIREALAAADGNRTRAAKLLGISRATIFRKIKQYELG